MSRRQLENQLLTARQGLETCGKTVFDHLELAALTSRARPYRGIRLSGLNTRYDGVFRAVRLTA